MALKKGLAEPITKETAGAAFDRSHDGDGDGDGDGQSKPSDWLKRGLYFLKAAPQQTSPLGMLETAHTCFQRAGNGYEGLAQLAEANIMATVAHLPEGKAKAPKGRAQRKLGLLKAAAACLVARDGKTAASCLAHKAAGEPKLAAKIMAGMGDNVPAAKLFERAGAYLEAADAWIANGQKDRGKKLLLRHRLFAAYIAKCDLDGSKVDGEVVNRVVKQLMNKCDDEEAFNKKVKQALLKKQLVGVLDEAQNEEARRIRAALDEERTSSERPIRVQISAFLDRMADEEAVR